MPGGRQTTPLFDLLRRGNAGATPAPTRESSRVAKPMVRVELKPQAESPLTGSRDIPPEAGLQAVRVPVNTLWFVAAGAITLLVVLFASGYKLGQGAAQRQAERELSGRFGDRPNLTEPGEQTQSGPPPNVEPGPPRSGVISQPPLNRPEVDTGGIGAGTGAVLSSKGVMADPRERGKNYLALATLSRSDSEAAILFMAANGVEVIGVPVDRGAGRANNAAPAYRLFAAAGITSEQFRTKQTARTNLEAEVARLGEIWQKQHRGPSSFAKTGWEKHQ